MAATPAANVVWMDLPSRTTISQGVAHIASTRALVRQGRLIPAPTARPRLSIFFHLLTFPDNQVRVIFDRSFDLLMQEQAWEREARAMFAHIAADYVEPTNLDFLAQRFCCYTSSSVRRLHMMDVVSMDLFSTIFVGMNYSSTIGRLNFSDDDDDDADYDDDDDDDEDDTDYDNDDDDDDNDDEDDADYDDDDDDDDDDDNDDEDDDDDADYDDDDNSHSDSGSRPASAAAVESLKMVAAEEPDSCSICLEDFVMAAPVLLAMPCSHLFHATCLKKWLEQSCSCPLCRFSLPQEH